MLYIIDFLQIGRLHRNFVFHVRRKVDVLNERKQKSEVNPGVAQAAEEVTSPVFI